MTRKKKPKPKDKEAPAEEAPVSIEAERDDLLARLQRLSADFLNYKKRVQRDMEQARQYANEELIKALLAVLDDMERGIQAGRDNHAKDDPLLTGMEMVHRKALEVLAGFGLESIEAEGKPFDPDQHRAMLQEVSDRHPPRTVLREIQKGYKLKGRTIRPSGVVVSQEPEQQPEEDDPTADQTEDQGVQ